MALTPSNMLPLGTPAPGFELPATDGKTYSLRDFSEGRLLLVAFICNHCPFVKHIQAELARLGRDCIEWGVAMVAISSNDVKGGLDDRAIGRLASMVDSVIDMGRRLNAPPPPTDVPFT